MHYYKRHIGDYIKDASHLTLLEHGAYVRLMDVYYSREAPLPLDEQEVFRLLTARDRRETAAIISVLREFWTQTPEGWVQSRCDHEIEKARQKADINRENGKQGGRPPKSQAKSKPRNNPDGYETEPNSIPSSENLETQTKPYPTTSVSHYPTTQLPEGDGKGSDGAVLPEVEPPGTNPPRAHGAPADPDLDPDNHAGWLSVAEVYPAGNYGDEQMLIAEKRARQRVAEGSTWNELRRATLAMAAQKRAQGKIGTDKVWNPVNFFGPEQELPGRFVFQREFKLPAPAEKPDTRLIEEQVNLQKLKDRRLAIGIADFPDPDPGESADAYRIRQDAEYARRQPRDVGNLVSSIADAKRIGR